MLNSWESLATNFPQLFNGSLYPLLESFTDAYPAKKDSSVNGWKHKPLSQNLDTLTKE